MNTIATQLKFKPTQIISFKTIILAIHTDYEAVHKISEKERYYSKILQGKSGREEPIEKPTEGRF